MTVKIDQALPRLRVPVFITLALLAAAVVTLSMVGGGLSVEKAEGVVTPGDPEMEKEWKEVDRLVDEQKFEAASKRVAEIRERAQDAGDGENWTRALVKEVQLRMGLHGYETAVRFLKAQPWPEDPAHRSVLNLFYARSLVEYTRIYSWEIGQRERVAAEGEVDLKKWTRGQIYDEARRAFLVVWKDRAALGSKPVAAWSEYLEVNTYPDGIRGTLRDTVSYLFAELLADSSFWTPEQSNELYRLDLDALLGESEKPGGALDAIGSAWNRLFGGADEKDETAVLEDPEIHPVVKYCWVLSDLETWHAEKRDRAAALEAVLERIHRLHGTFSEAEDREKITENLRKQLPAYRGVSWWATGQAQLAEFVRGESRPQALVDARKVALQGHDAYPKSPGGERCLHIVRSIEAPDFSLESMSSDGKGRRSVAISHRNLTALHFRAYSVDLLYRIGTVTDYNLLPDWNEIRDTMQKTAPAATWSVDLPKTPDFRSHQTFVTPPMGETGFYVVAASARRDFREQENRILGLNFLVTDLVLVTRNDESGGLEARVLSGGTGEPVRGAAVDLYRHDWKTGHTRIGTKKSDAGGLAAFSSSSAGEGNRRSHFFVARLEDDYTLDEGYLSFQDPPRPRRVEASLIFTDRSVYRPGQTLYWKVLAYEGGGEQVRYEILRSAPVTVSLRDANGETVEEALVSTNTYGSASGAFTIPSGRALGAWNVRSSLQGGASVRVEEYKRPTFEAELRDPETPLRLNQPATFTGEAKYYFGLPVTSGAVKWRVTREPVYPRWWGWFFRGSPGHTQAQTVAVGTSSLDEEGAFQVAFTPEADERKAEQGVTYRYRVKADITDEGGETRSAERTFRLGFVSVEARITMDGGFFRAGEKTEMRIYRSDLNGVPRAGEGTWRLLALSQPERTLLPVEQPMPELPDDEGKEKPYRTEGDDLRPRWDTGISTEAILRSWKDGKEVTEGRVTHGEGGEAVVGLPDLKPGAYRLRYETVDDFGRTCEAMQDLIVAGKQTPVNLPALLLVERPTVAVGEKARLLVLSGIKDQTLFLDVYRGQKLRERRILRTGKDASLIEIPIESADRGGFGVRLSLLRDHQFMEQRGTVFVPWEDKRLSVEFATFRDKIRPGARETWRVTLKDHEGKPVEAETAELLAYMYDKSLDVFAPHNPPSVPGLYPSRAWIGQVRASLGRSTPRYREDWDFTDIPGYPSFRADRLEVLSGYGIGGPGRRNRMMFKAGAVAEGMAMPMSAPPPAPEEMMDMAAEPDMELSEDESAAVGGEAEPEPEATVELRSDFSETAFWEPHLLLDSEGAAVIEFDVPDSVTAWNVWVHGVTRDMRGGSLHQETQSVKDLMVRPYLPRFLREGDRAELKVVVNNASEKVLSGRVTLEIHDPETNENLMEAFGFGGKAAQSLPFEVEPGRGTNVSFPLTAPPRPGSAAFKVVAVSGDTSDGELRPLPILPGRMHLAQSRFVTLKNDDTRTMTFEDMARGGDPTLVHDALVVTVDAQLFYGVLEALPYLVDYPYECTEQILNRFVTTGILSSLYDDYPSVERMAKEFSKRETRLETWDAVDPNRKMALEETPWLVQARGGKDAGHGLTKVLDPRIARAEREASLAKLEKAQTSIGGFPWWPGGPPSPYMTLYIMYGLAKASEFGVDIPQGMVQRGWQYLAQHFREEYAKKMIEEDCCWEFLTFLNYAATCYPDPSWMGDALTDKERKQILNHCFKHWREHSPYLKGLLALTLDRMGRPEDAHLVFDSVMDSSKTTQDEGTFWAPEDRAWLWYNDTIETHAYALRTLTELEPEDARRHGLVQWLFLNKKLNHWKSTRATAEVIYSLVHYLRQEGALGVREEISVDVGHQETTFVFEPDRYTGKKNQVVIPGEKVDPATCSEITVEKAGKGLAFASATWHFSTEKLPEEARGDFFGVTRTFFKRERSAKEVVLKPLSDGDLLHVGDEIEVHISLRTKHAAEYVHLRDPRAAGCEPTAFASGYRWDLGLVYYEEIRDSGENFFFEWLPVGEYTFKYRIRATMAGTFKVAPATVQSMYAPEFNAYSSGAVLDIGPAE